MLHNIFESLRTEWLKDYSLDKFLNVYPQAKPNSIALGYLLSHQFKSETLPIMALTHSSALVKWQKNKSGIFSNEKLEFLGDSLLNFYVSVSVSRFCPKWSEADLSRSRARLVSTENLSKKSKFLDLISLMIFGSEESKNQCAKSDAVMADAFEAICASLFLDSGLEKTFEWLDLQFKEDFLEEKNLDFSSIDVKSQVQSWLQRIAPVVPQYKFYPCHVNKDHFVCEVSVYGHTLTSTSGPNKQKASVEAARIIWEKISQGNLSPASILELKKLSKDFYNE